MKTIFIQLPAWGLRLWVLACYLFVYGGLAPLMAPKHEAPAPSRWEALVSGKGMSCGGKKGLICACTSHGKGTACCCLPKQGPKTLAWNAAPCGQAERPSLAAFGSHFQAFFPNPVRLEDRSQALAHKDASTFVQTLFSEVPEKVPRG